MDVTKLVRGHRSSYLIDDFHISIMKTRIREMDTKERNKSIDTACTHVDTQINPKGIHSVKIYV